MKKTLWIPLIVIAAFLVLFWRLMFVSYYNTKHVEQDIVAVKNSDTSVELTDTFSDTAALGLEHKMLSDYPLSISDYDAIFMNTGAFMQDEESTDRTLSIIAVGDNLIHMPVLNSGKSDDGTFDYRYMYAPIKDKLSLFDIRIINQETIFVNDKNKYSSYPMFGSPVEIGDALIDAGFNVITSATNHSIDKGESGIFDTINYWKQHPEITVAGLCETEGDYHEIPIRETNGIKVAYLNYTYGLNGLVLPKDKPYLVKTLDNKEFVLSELSLANELADIVIVLPHWGDEYKYSPSAYQQDWAQFFADNGADIIIGTHPHVVEPLLYIKTADGREVPCFYSLGNFISGQTEVDRNLGGMAEIMLSLNKDGDIIKLECELTPIVTHRDASTSKFYAYLLEDYTDELASRHYLTARGKSMYPDTLYSLFGKIIGK